MSVEKPLPDAWIEDLDEDIPIRVEKYRLEEMGLTQDEEDSWGTVETWKGGDYKFRYQKGSNEIVDYEKI